MTVPVTGRDGRPLAVDPVTGRAVATDMTGTPVVAAPVTTPVASETVRPVGTVDPNAAYEQGRVDALRTEREAEARARERIDAERRTTPRRGGHPLLTLIIVVLALIGVAAIYLVVTRGSAQQGGAAVDSKVSTVVQPAKDAVDDVRTTTGQAVENAGEALKGTGEKIKP